MRNSDGRCWCGNAAHSVKQHGIELLNLKDLRHKSIDFNSDLFVSKVQMMDTGDLLQACDRIKCVVAIVSADTFQSKLKANWLLGVYEREVRARGVRAI